MADETATTSGEEHVASPPKVSKAKEIPQKGQKAAPKLVVNQSVKKCALLADETATTSGKEHVASPPKVSKAKEIPKKGQKAAPKLFVNQSATKAMASNSDMDVEDFFQICALHKITQMIRYIQKMKRMVGLGLIKILVPKIFIDLSDLVETT